MTIEQSAIAPRVPEWTIQDKLRKARTTAGYDQGQLAELMDISRGLVSGYELGTMKPKRSNVIAWAFACDVDPHWLLPHLDLNQEPFGYGTSQVTAARCWHDWKISGPHQMRCSKCGDVMQRPLAVVVDLGAYRLGRAS